MAAKRININRLFARHQGTYYYLEGAFIYPDGFKGCTGSCFCPIPESVMEERLDPDNSDTQDYFREQWSMQARNGDTDESLAEFTANILSVDGKDAVFDLSYFSIGEEIAQVYNSELPPDHDPGDEAEYCECVGGGRTFDFDGIHGVPFEELDKIYAPELIAVIKKYEKPKVKRKSKVGA